MKKIALLMFVLSTQLLLSQTTYNKRMHMGFPHSILTGIIVTDSCFYVSGVIGDSIYPYRTGNIFAKMSHEGEVIYAKKLTDSLKTYETWNNSFKKSIDGNFITGGYGTDNGGRVFLLKHTDTGDTLFIRNYRNPSYPFEQFITYQGVVENIDTTYVLANIIFNSGTGSNQTYVLKVNKTGEIEWDKRYYVGDLNSGGVKIIKEGDGYLIGGWISNTNIVSNNFDSQTWLLKIDSIGEIEWDYRSPEDELQGLAWDILQSPDGGLVIASTKGIEQGSGANAQLRWHIYVYKINEDREFEWGVDIRDIIPSENYLTKLIALSDGSAYVATGTIFEDTPDFGYNINGILTKISTTGDSLWTRYYSHVDSPADNHIFYDVEETPDGGFVMVGQATDNMTTGELPLQQAWIVKVDQHGCLVPGCHLIDDVESPQIDVQISLYPNPTRDYLNIFYYHPNHRGKVTYQIVDIQGRVLRSFERSRNNITHMISLGDLVSGQYFLRLENEEGKVVTRTFVKE